MLKLTVKTYLNEVGITQKELAEMLGIPSSTLNRRLSSPASITVEQLGEIADKLQTSINKLVEEESVETSVMTCGPVTVTVMVQDKKGGAA